MNRAALCVFRGRTHSSTKICSFVFQSISTRIMSENSYQADTHSVCYVTTPNEEVAKSLARGLVTERLAACINVIPKITSIYSWEGKINEDTEVMMMIKTRSSRINDLTKYIVAHHPYSVCEVISLPIKGGNDPYLKWIGDIVEQK